MSIHRTTDEPPLDTFESALLDQLTAVVDERATSPSRRRISRPARWSAAAAAAAAGVAAVFVLPGGTPAYAVQTDSSGSVTITINELADASALKDALAAKGITADVTYPGVGKQCAPGRFTEAPNAGLPQLSGSAAFTASAGNDGFAMTIPKELIKPDQTLVLESVWPDSTTWMIKVAMAEGSVGPCQLVDADQIITSPEGSPPADVPMGGEPTAFATAE